MISWVMIVPDLALRPMTNTMIWVRAPSLIIAIMIMLALDASLNVGTRSIQKVSHFYSGLLAIEGV
jgi:hypothetical protein